MSTKNEDKNQESSFAEAINLTGFGKYNYYQTFVCGLVASTILLIGIDLSYTLPAALCDLQLTPSSKAISSSAVFLGTMSSSHLSGLLIDVLGRQYIMVRSLILMTCIHILISFAPNFITFAVLKTLIGFVGCSSTVAVFVYIGECSPAAKTSQVISFIVAIASGSFMYVTGLAWLILPGQWSLNIGVYTYQPWRLFLLACGIPFVTAAILMSFLPESPKFVLACGDKKQALVTLQNIYSVNTGHSKENYPVKCLADIPEEHVTLLKNPSQILHRMWSQTYPLFLPPYLLKTVMYSFFYFNVFLCVNAISVWIPEMSNRMALTTSLSPNQTFTLCEMMIKVTTSHEFMEPPTQLLETEDFNITKPMYNLSLKESVVLKSECAVEIKKEIFLPNMLMGAVQPLGNILVGIIIPLFEKKIALMISSSLACLLLALAILIQNQTVILTIFTVYLPVMGVIYNINTSLIVDFIPTNYRGMAVSLCMMFGRLGSIFGNVAFSFMLDTYCETMFYIFIGLLLVGCIMTLFIRKPKP